MTCRYRATAIYTTTTAVEARVLLTNMRRSNPQISLTVKAPFSEFPARDTLTN